MTAVLASTQPAPLEEWLAVLIADNCAVDRRDLHDQAFETITGGPA
jgi:hypothetical protein